MQITKINYKLLLIIYLIVFTIGYICKEQYLSKYPFINNLNVPRKDYYDVTAKLNNIANEHGITVQTAHNFIEQYFGYQNIDDTAKINTALRYCVKSGFISKSLAIQYFDSLDLVDRIVFLKKIQEINDKLERGDN